MCVTYYIDYEHEFFGWCQSRGEAMVNSGVDRYDIPAFLRKQAD